jgi:hypothetical protein
MRVPRLLVPASRGRAARSDGARILLGLSALSSLPTFGGVLMSLPKGVAKADNGAIFMLRERDELEGWTDAQLRERLRFVRAYTDPESAGVAFLRSDVRLIAMRERRALVFEIDRRVTLARELAKSHNNNDRKDTT